MAKKSSSLASWLQTTAIRVTRVHFLYIACYIVSIVVFDSWNLITHEAVSDFWTAAGVLLALNTIFWYISHIKLPASSSYLFLVLGLITADIVFAGFTVYWERGLASSGVILFAVPIVTAAVLRSRTTLLATAALSAVAYSVAAVRYFYEHFGESYRVELYGEIFLYSAVFFVLAFLAQIIIRPGQERL